MKFIKSLIIFILINLSALFVGGRLMNNGPMSEWYSSLSKAPWTPDGWVFGFAWTSIMICFAVYMALLYNSSIRKTNIIILFIFQYILNISWNYVFFNQHHTQFGLVIIFALLTIMVIFFTRYYSLLKLKSLWSLPYILWLIVATSLNAYIVFEN